MKLKIPSTIVLRSRFMSHSRLVLEISWTADVSFKKERNREGSRSWSSSSHAAAWLVAAGALSPYSLHDVDYGMLANTSMRWTPRL